MRWVVKVTSRPRFTPVTHWTRGWVGPSACLDTEASGKILSLLPRIEPRLPGLPVCSQTLYWLSYPGSSYVNDTDGKYLIFQPVQSRSGGVGVDFIQNFAKKAHADVMLLEHNVYVWTFWKLIVKKISSDTGYPDRGFRGFTQSLKVNDGIVP
jgi:hypothetical protein